MCMHSYTYIHMRVGACICVHVYILYMYTLHTWALPFLTCHDFLRARNVFSPHPKCGVLVFTSNHRSLTSFSTDFYCTLPAFRSASTYNGCLLGSYAADASADIFLKECFIIFFETWLNGIFFHIFFILRFCTGLHTGLHTFSILN